ncbi:MAG: hypothetical protein CM1200mP10_21830 [Candidatus Neomarinimicrobiota bacterium]|nr:MAG: hypothetical protein CM1200mP10_21830 [Candidatus Neomarinimicrobiota bacterium]
MVCNVFLLHAQTKLDSLDSLIKLNETLVIDTVIRLDSLQNLIEDLQESYAREQFLVLEREAVIRINRAAFAGMWINKPLFGETYRHSARRGSYILPLLYSGLHPYIF